MIHSAQTPAVLILEDGSLFNGYTFGSNAPARGEVVFCSAMVGYPEILSNPAYTGKIVAFTYPIIGNYGVTAPFGRQKIYASGVVVTQYSEHFSHWDAAGTFNQWLVDQGVPALYGVDTRHLVQVLRDHGAQQGQILLGATHAGAEAPHKPAITMEQAVAAASVAEQKVWVEEGNTTVALLDLGATKHYVEQLALRCAQEGKRLVQLPWNTSLESVPFHELILSEGPAMAVTLPQVVLEIKKVLLRKIPVEGIGLGMLLLAQAAGASLVKHNTGLFSNGIPVRKLGTPHCAISTQHNSYQVDPHTLPSSWEVVYQNMNDSTVAAIKHKTLPFKGQAYSCLS